MSAVQRAIVQVVTPVSRRTHHGGWFHPVDDWLRGALHNAYVVSILSNVLTLIILGFLSWTIFLATRRRKLQSFFGLKGTRRLLIYVSNLHLDSFASQGIDGAYRSYSGGAVPEYETRLSAVIQRFFDSLTPRTRQRAGLLRFLRWSDLNIEIVPSPPTVNMVRFDAPLLAIGSPGYNAASQAIENKADTLVRLADDNASVEVVGGRVFNDAEVALVQRTVDASGRIAFYVAGPSARGTTGAAHYLFARWRQLTRRYRGRPFYVVLRVVNDEASDWVELDSSPDLKWKQRQAKVDPLSAAEKLTPYILLVFILLLFRLRRRGRGL